MTTITKQQVEELIDRLAGKEQEVLYRCNRVWEAWQIGTMTEEDFEEVVPPILIGDVLKIFREHDYEWGGERRERALKLMTLFQASGGEDLSLQEIAGRIEYGARCDCNKNNCMFKFAHEIAKPSPEADLLLFIHNLGL